MTVVCRWHARIEAMSTDVFEEVVALIRSDALQAEAGVVLRGFLGPVGLLSDLLMQLVTCKLVKPRVAPLPGAAPAAEAEATVELPESPGALGAAVSPPPLRPAVVPQLPIGEDGLPSSPFEAPPGGFTAVTKYQQ